MALKLTLATAKKDTVYGLSIVVMVLSGAVHYFAHTIPSGWVLLFQAVVGAGSLILGMLGAPVPLLVRAPKPSPQSDVQSAPPPAATEPVPPADRPGRHEAPN